MNKIEAMQALLDGAKLRLPEWDDGLYIYMENDRICTQNGTEYKDLFQFSSWEKCFGSSFEELKVGATFKSDFNSMVYRKFEVVFVPVKDHYVVVKDFITNNPYIIYQSDFIYWKIINYTPPSNQ